MMDPLTASVAKFQLTAARRRLVAKTVGVCGPLVFQLTAARRRLAALATATMQESMVSTHSRPKAAGHTLRRPCRGDQFQLTAARRRLG